jgi:hypothetical protein
MTSPVPERVIDTLNGLMDAEATSIFRTVADASPHVRGADPSIREPIDQLRQLSQRHARELRDLILSRGGVPRGGEAGPAEEQNLAFLSLRFLLPKLVAEKDLILTRYENAKATIGPGFPDVIAMLERIEGEQRHFLEVLGRAAEAVNDGRYQAPPHDQPPRPAKGR